MARPSSSQLRITLIQRFAAIGALFAAAVALGVVIKRPSSTIEYGIAAGVLGALLVSALDLIVDYFVIGETPTDVVRGAERLDESLRSLKRYSGLLARAAEHGYEDVKPKIAYSSQEWLALLEEAQTTLVLVGHALDKWCLPDFRDALERTILRLARDDKPVELLMLPVDGANTEVVGGLRNQDYGDRVSTTLRTLARIRSNLKEPSQQHLTVRVLHSNVPMPYMLVGHQDTLITCAYPGAGHSSDDMPTIRLSAQSAAGRTMRGDLERLLASHADPVDWSVVA